MRCLDATEIQLLLDTSERFPDAEEWAKAHDLAARGLGAMESSSNYPGMVVFVPNSLGVQLALISQSLSQGV